MGQRGFDPRRESVTLDEHGRRCYRKALLSGSRILVRYSLRSGPALRILL
jgi:hypothetical protein